jgi:hypothetical protein
MYCQCKLIFIFVNDKYVGIICIECHLNTCICCGKSFMYNKNRMGPRIDPWGTQYKLFLNEDLYFLRLPLCFCYVYCYVHKVFRICLIMCFDFLLNLCCQC